MSTWAGGPWLGVDTESTGVDPLTARLVTACLAFRSASDSGWTLDWLADAGGEEIPELASALHGVTTERTRAEGRPVGGVAAEVRALLVEAWGNGVPVVAYNANYDLTLLDAELRRAGLDPLTIDGPVLDPLVLDRAADRYRRGSRKLGDVCTHYRVPHTAAAPGEDATLAAGAHDATADVLATLRVLWRIGQKFPALAALTAEELHERQVAAYAEWATHLQDYLRSSGKEPDAVISTDWPIRRVPQGVSA